jgi:hypothetical protein
MPSEPRREDAAALGRLIEKLRATPDEHTGYTPNQLTRTTLERRRSVQYLEELKEIYERWNDGCEPAEIIANRISDDACIFTQADVGCHIDGALGSNHRRERLAGFVEALEEQSAYAAELSSFDSNEELLKALREWDSDDLEEENVVVEALQANTVEGLTWIWEAGDLILTTDDQLGEVHHPGYPDKDRCLQDRNPEAFKTTIPSRQDPEAEYHAQLDVIAGYLSCAREDLPKIAEHGGP